MAHPPLGSNLKEARGDVPLTSEAYYQILDLKGVEVLVISVTSFVGHRFKKTGFLLLLLALGGAG